MWKKNKEELVDNLIDKSDSSITVWENMESKSDRYGAQQVAVMQLKLGRFADKHKKEDPGLRVIDG